MTIKIDGRVLKCSTCKGSKIWRKGEVPSPGGRKQRYICYDCGKSFYYSPPSRSKKTEVV